MLGAPTPGTVSRTRRREPEGTSSARTPNASIAIAHGTAPQSCLHLCCTSSSAVACVAVCSTAHAAARLPPADAARSAVAATICSAAAPLPICSSITDGGRRTAVAAAASCCTLQHMRASTDAPCGARGARGAAAATRVPSRGTPRHCIYRRINADAPFTAPIAARAALAVVY